MKPTKIFITSILLTLMSIALTSSTIDFEKKSPPPPPLPSYFTVIVTVENVPFSTDATVEVWGSDGFTFSPSIQDYSYTIDDYYFKSDESILQGEIYARVFYTTYPGGQRMVGTANISGYFLRGNYYFITISRYSLHIEN